MKQNMGTVDRTLRIAVAVIRGALYVPGGVSGRRARVLGFFAAIFVLTSFLGTCPLYIPLGISTRKE